MCVPKFSPKLYFLETFCPYSSLIVPFWLTLHQIGSGCFIIFLSLRRDRYGWVWSDKTISDTHIPSFTHFVWVASDYNFLSVFCQRFCIVFIEAKSHSWCRSWPEFLRAIIFAVYSWMENIGLLVFFFVAFL